MNVSYGEGNAGYLSTKLAGHGDLSQVKDPIGYTWYTIVADQASIAQHESTFAMSQIVIDQLSLVADSNLLFKVQE